MTSADRRIRSALVLLDQAVAAIGGDHEQRVLLVGKSELGQELRYLVRQLCLIAGGQFVPDLGRSIAKGDTVTDKSPPDVQLLASRLLEVRSLFLAIEGAHAGTRGATTMKNVLVQAGRDYLTAVQHLLPEETAQVKKQPSIDEEFLAARVDAIRTIVKRVESAAPSGKHERHLQLVIVQAGTDFLATVQHLLPEETKNG